MAMSDESRQIVTDPAEIRRLQLQVRADPWAANEAATHARLREAGRRSLGENLSEALELSGLALALANSMKQKRASR